MRVVLQNDLLEPVERALVRHALAHLRHRLPQNVGLHLVAVGTHHCNHVSDQRRSQCVAHYSLLLTTYSMTNDCCKMVPFITSFWMVTLTLRRLACGSVQTKPASINLTLEMPVVV